MTTWLLANVGSSDVQIADPARIPKGEDGRPLPPRQLGEAVLNDFKAHQDALSLPLIAPTLRWLARSGVNTGDLRVVLFASDQPKGTEAKLYNSDTIHYADIIKRVLCEKGVFEQVMQPGKDRDNLKHAASAKHIQIKTIQGSPADYNNLLAFYTQTLRKVDVGSDDEVYLEVTGGTPAMTSMLILVGVDAFDARVRTLYVDRDSDQPYELGVERELRARRIRRDMQTHIRSYAYAAAARILEGNEAVVADERKRKRLAALLEYADRRLAFDFERARAALSRARGHSTGTLQSQIANWLHTLRDPQIAELMAELIYSAVIKQKQGEYADLTQRLFRFQEEAFRWMAEQFGMKYGKSDEYVSESWLDSQPGLREFSEAYQAPGAAKPTALDWKRSLNRTLLGAVVDFFIQQGQRPEWRSAVDDLHRLSKAADLRNKGLAGHGFKGIGAEDIESAFGMTIDALLEMVSAIHRDLFGALPSSPYDDINSTLAELLRDDR